MSTTPVFSFEFFPPKTNKGRDNLISTLQTLGELKPRYFSVTYGAGGSTQDGTLDTILTIQKAGFNAAPHISCIGSSRETMHQLLTQYKDQGINHLVALRGDLPSGSLGVGDFPYANTLVEFIREQSGEHFYIEVAAYPEYHPQSPSPQIDFENFKRKVDAGANSAITQYFYNIDAYFHFLNRCEQANITIPIIPGIMPISNYARLARFSDMCGAEIPRWIRKQLESYQDDTASIQSFGLDVVTNICQKLLDAHVPGLHFYSLNQVEPTLSLWKRLQLS